MTAARVVLLLTVLVALATSGASAQTAGAAPPLKVVGVGPQGATAFEFIAKVDQEGPVFTISGYVTRVRGVPAASLFSDPTSRSEATARLTLRGRTTLTARSTIENLFVTNSSGRVRVYLQQQPHGDFDDPASFRSNDRIAALGLHFHNTVNVQAPSQGISIGTGELRQLAAERFSLAGRRYRLGRVGLRERLFVAGQGTLFDPTLPRSTLVLAGDAFIRG